MSPIEQDLLREVKNFIAGGRTINNTFKSEAGRQLQQGNNNVMCIVHSNTRVLNQLEQKYLPVEQQSDSSKTGS